MPKVPETLAPRRKSRQIRVGKVLVGGDAPVSVQSMCTTPTTNINATLQQIAALTASGCEIVRGGAGEPGQQPQVRRSGGCDREGGSGCRSVAAHRRQRGLARPETAAEV